MNGRELHFAPPSVEGFVDALAPLWANAFAKVELMGENELSVATRVAARQHGSTIEHCTMPDTTSRIKGKRLIIFTETDGAKLAAQLLLCVDVNDVVVVAPVTDWHFSRKPLFLISIPKAGTHLLYELAQALGYRPGVELPEFPLPQTWYCVEYGNSHTVAQDFFVDTVRHSPFGNRHHPFPRTPALFIYRHPLDILVSEANYYHRDGKTVFSAYYDRLDFDARVTRLMQDSGLLGSLRERIGGFLPWLEFPNVVPFSFEELIGTRGDGNQEAQLDLIWSIQLKLQAPGMDAEIAGKVFNPDAETFREGRIGSYVKQLLPEVINRFAVENSDILAQLGYPEDGSPAIPRKGKEHRSKALQYSLTDHSHTPLTIESGYLGCNLVQYNQRVYAVPMTAGPIALEKLAPETLGELPVASTLVELKALLLVGKASLAEHVIALDSLAVALRTGSEIPAASRIWSDPAAPSIVAEYKGFNLIAWRGKFLALRQTLGPIELHGNIEEIDNIAAQQTIGDLLIAPSIAGLRNDIEVRSIALETNRLFKELAQSFDAARQSSDIWYEAVRRQTEEQQRQIGDASQRAAELDSAIQEMQERHAAAQVASDQKLQAMWEQALVANARANELESAALRSSQELQARLDAVLTMASANHEALHGQFQGLQRRADETNQRVTETANLLARLRDQLSTAQVDAEAKHQAVSQFAQELAMQLRDAGQRADETDRLFNELLKHFDATRSEADLRHRAVAQQLQQRFDSYEAAVTEKHRAAQAEATAEHMRLHARLDDLQNQTNILGRNLFVRIGTKIGRFLRIK